MSTTLRTRLATALVLSVIFVSGGAVGIALDRTLVRTGEVTSAEPDGPGTGSRLVIDQVALSPDQRARVDSVLAEFRGDMIELYREVEPLYRERVAGARDAIRAILDDEQRAHYDSLLAERDAESTFNPDR
jgi:hypothetical protein